MRLINADALMEDIEDWYNRIGETMNLLDTTIRNVLSSVMDNINEAPTIEAARVVAHARWKHDMYFDQPVMRCTACGRGFDEGHHAEKFPHCPHCGAKMDAKEEEHAAD